MNKHQLLSMALHRRHETRRAETIADYCAAVSFSNYATTDFVCRMLTGQTISHPVDWRDYEQVRETLNTLRRYISNDGRAGEQGSYWKLTEEGEKIAKTHFELQLLSQHD
jgi:hypothetical protein